MEPHWEEIEEAFLGEDLPVNAVRRLFDRFDLRVDDDEFRKVLGRLGGVSDVVRYPVFVQMFAPQTYKMPTVHFGAGHGTRKVAEIPLVSADHAEKLLREKMNLMQAEISKAFRKLDADRSGTLTHEEFASVLERFNIRMTRPELKRLVKRFDADLSGDVNYLEFVQICEKPLATTSANAVVYDKTFQPKDADFDPRNWNARPQSSASMRPVSVSSLEAQVLGNLPYLQGRLQEIDREKNGVVKASDFVVVLVDAGVNIGSQGQLASLIAGYSNGTNPDSQVRWADFLNSRTQRLEQKKAAVMKGWRN